MIIQLLFISILYTVFYLPLVILTIAHLCGVPDEVGADARRYMYFFTYFIPLLMPYVCLISLPELWKKLKIHPIQRSMARLQRRNIVAPLVLQNQ